MLLILFLKNMIKINVLIVLVFFLLFGCKTNKKETKTLLFVGSFTDKKPGKGIHVYEFNEATGKSILKFTLDSITNTSFLKLSLNGKILYSVVDSQMAHNGKVAAFKVDVSGSKIKLISMQDCGGLNPAHLEVDKSGKYLSSSNYSDGSLSLFTIKKNGSLSQSSQVLKFKDSSIIKSRQSSSHIHSSNFSPDNNYLFAFDLGADKIRRFELTKHQGEISLKNQKEIQTKLGSGPRHFTFHPNGKFGYLVNELSGKIDTYNYTNGRLDFIEDYSSYEQKQDVYKTADIHISSDGRFLYTSNRGPEADTIAVFSINLKSGKLQIVEHIKTGGNHPRNFAISPSGKYLLVANQFSNNITIFKRDFITGKLTKMTHQILLNNPSSIQMKRY